MKIAKVDIVVAILAGIACYAMLVQLPVWAIFISWAWYFTLGSKPEIFRQAFPTMVLGYFLSSVAILVTTASGSNMFVLALIVAVTVLAVMLAVKTKTFACSLPAFNSYSCMFAGYYAGNFPKMEPMALDINNVVICAIWLFLANLVGLGFGYASIRLGVGKTDA